LPLEQRAESWNDSPLRGRPTGAPVALVCDVGPAPSAPLRFAESSPQPLRGCLERPPLRSTIRPAALA
jgi:hypothetical protein